MFLVCIYIYIFGALAGENNGSAFLGPQSRSMGTP